MTKWILAAGAAALAIASPALADPGGKVVARVAAKAANSRPRRTRAAGRPQRQV